MNSKDNSTSFHCDDCRAMGKLCPVKGNCDLPKLFFQHFKSAFGLDKKSWPSLSPPGELENFAHSVLKCLLESFTEPVNLRSGFETTSDVYVNIVKSFSEALVTGAKANGSGRRDGKTLRRFQLTTMLPEEFFNGPQQTTLIVPPISNEGPSERHCRLTRRWWRRDFRRPKRSEEYHAGYEEMNGPFWTGTRELFLERLILVRDHEVTKLKHEGMLSLWTDNELLKQTKLLIRKNASAVSLKDLFGTDSKENSAIVSRILGDDLGAESATEKMLLQEIERAFLGEANVIAKASRIIEDVLKDKREKRLKRFENALGKSDRFAYPIRKADAASTIPNGWEPLLDRFLKQHCGEKENSTANYLVLTDNSLDQFKPSLSSFNYPIARSLYDHAIPEIALFGYDKPGTDITSQTTDWICGLFADYEQFTREMFIRLVPQEDCLKIQKELREFISESKKEKFRTAKDVKPTLYKYGAIANLSIPVIDVRISNVRTRRKIEPDKTGPEPKTLIQKVEERICRIVKRAVEPMSATAIWNTFCDSLTDNPLRFNGSNFDPWHKTKGIAIVTNLGTEGFLKKVGKKKWVWSSNADAD